MSLVPIGYILSLSYQHYNCMSPYYVHYLILSMTMNILRTIFFHSNIIIFQNRLKTSNISPKNILQKAVIMIENYYIVKTMNATFNNQLN